ncbi:MAG TPA: hypothetical protein VLU38_03680 [Methanomassiliicoccales archaeon]|nr:hypothetical protein [Methanomassiliicoccales archaeon]
MKVKIGPRMLAILWCCIAMLSLTLLPLLTSPAAAAPQSVTLTLTSSTPSNLTAYNYLLELTASAPINGSITLYWSINGYGSYYNVTQITNGHLIRVFGAQSSGNWTLWYVWPGDDQYAQSQSNYVWLDGNPGNSSPSYGSNTTLYVASAVVAVIVIIALVYLFMRSRGTKK